MLNIPVERIEFESVMRKNGFPDMHLRKDRKGNYLRKNTESAFQGWLLKAATEKEKSRIEMADQNRIFIDVEDLLRVTGR